MKARGGKAQKQVALPHRGPVDEPVPFHRPHAEARQIIDPLAVEARHLGRLSAQKGAARLPAAFGHAGQHLPGHPWL